MKRYLNKGFSIVELIIATALFVIILSIIVSIYLRSLQVQKSALHLIEANDNLVLAIEEMARDLRNGTDFKDSDPLCSNSGSGLEFSIYTGETFCYRFDGSGTIEKGILNASSNNFDFLKITSNDIQISDFNMQKLPGFLVPRVVVSFAVSPKNDILQGVKTYIQTTVSARNI